VNGAILQKEIKGFPMKVQKPAVEWPTLALLLATYGALALATTWVWQWSPVAGFLLASVAIAQFSSLQHEVLHGHPFASRALSEAMVFPGITVFVPYQRFKELHLAHHHDPSLTDPYDDPESNFQDPAVWARRRAVTRLVYRAANTLAGRIVLGPMIGAWTLFSDDAIRIARGDLTVLLAWLLHAVGVCLVLAWLVTVGSMPVWAYAAAAYAGWSLLKIRTYLEHRAHENARARTVIIESRGPLSLLFLNNNFHAVHHMHPKAAWYLLPALYAQNREHYLRCNDGYFYRNYTEIFRKYLFRAKDPVPHPLWPGVMAKGVENCQDAPELRAPAE
jgi:fatty acid desaturase